MSRQVGIELWAACEPDEADRCRDGECEPEGEGEKIGASNAYIGGKGDIGEWLRELEEEEREEEGEACESCAKTGTSTSRGRCDPEPECEKV